MNKKRKFLMGRPAALTKLGEKRIHSVRTMGGNTKYRALRLDAGSFSWGSESFSAKTRVIDVMYVTLQYSCVCFALYYFRFLHLFANASLDHQGLISI